MALLDEKRRYVDVNDAALEFFRYDRRDVIGSTVGFTAIRERRSDVHERWERLLRTGELYGDLVVKHAGGTPLRVSYAAHATRRSGRWLAVVVALSAAAEPDGPELLRGTQAADQPGDTALTARERDVVRHVALGSGTRQIACDLAISPETVRSHVRNAMSKTDTHTRAQLVAVALAKGLIEP